MLTYTVVLTPLSLCKVVHVFLSVDHLKNADSVVKETAVEREKDRITMTTKTEEGERRSNRRRSPLSQERGRGERGGGDEYFERGSQEEAVRGRESPYGKQTRYHDHSNKETEREKGGSRPHRDRDRGDDRGGYYRR